MKIPFITHPREYVIEKYGICVVNIFSNADGKWVLGLSLLKEYGILIDTRSKVVKHRFTRKPTYMELYCGYNPEYNFAPEKATRFSLRGKEIAES